MINLYKAGRIPINTIDNQTIVIAASSKVNGPGQENGLCFGMTYIWVSLDMCKTWARTSYRCKQQCAEDLSKHTMVELQSMYPKSY